VFKKNPLSQKCALDEQMMLSDPQTALLFQIREELKELNHNLKSLNKPPEMPSEIPKVKVEKKGKKQE
jgi:hypothetical protein